MSAFVGIAMLGLTIVLLGFSQILLVQDQARLKKRVIDLEWSLRTATKCGGSS